MSIQTTGEDIQGASEKYIKYLYLKSNPNSYRSRENRRHE